MYTVRDLEVVELLPTRQGIFVLAKYPEWYTVYNFFIDSGGQVKGKANSGEWLEITDELGGFIQAKVQAALIDRHGFLS